MNSLLTSPKASSSKTFFLNNKCLISRFEKPTVQRIYSYNKLLRALISRSLPRLNKAPKHLHCSRPPVIKADSSRENYILAGDIGGTNARLSLCAVKYGALQTVHEEVFGTCGFGEFSHVVKEMLKREKAEGKIPTVACFAVAGPILKKNYAKMTNIHWIIDGLALQKEFGFKVVVINDFEALGYGIPHLDQEKDIVVLNDTEASNKAPIAVLGPGTGLGEAQLMWDEGLGRYKVWPSEGSHTDFAPRTELQQKLMNWVQQKIGHCEVEHLACGRGLERIYSFLRSNDKEFKKLTAPEISKLALAKNDAVCVKAVDIMLSIIGAEAGNMALRSLAKGGVYIAGGITPRLIERIRGGVVLDAFMNHRDEKFRNILKEIRLSAVIESDVGLTGAKQYARAELEESEKKNKDQS